jgi:purine-binding chemotaxis protein CheW
MPVTELPHSPASVVGVTDHRGQVITVVDLRRHFGVTTPKNAKREKWILLETAAEPIGLVVDGVSGVFGAEGEHLRDTPQLSGVEEQGLLGVLSTPEGLIFVIDVERFVSLVNSARRESVHALEAPR